MPNVFPDMEEILAQMKNKFLDTAQEKLDRLNEILAELKASDGNKASLIDEFRREIHSLKGMGGTFQMPLVTQICHVFEAFLEGEDEFDLSLIEKSQLYVDRIADLIESDQADDETTLNYWLSGLPDKRQDDSSPQEEPVKQSALIICDDEAIANGLKDVFEESGFTCIAVKSPFRGYELAIKSKPTVIIASQVFTDMDGAELLRSLGAVRSLSHAQLAMVCPDRRKALDENLKTVHLLSEKNVDVDVMNFLAITLTP
ncbi:MAG: Hpt domain-containing protein [Methylocystaceae bacterium]|nr:Hpt domain-containing protein [Methylocystaceae bacterium]